MLGIVMGSFKWIRLMYTIINDNNENEMKLVMRNRMQY
jgi:hypothetical protein